MPFNVIYRNISASPELRANPVVYLVGTGKAPPAGSLLPLDGVPNLISSRDEVAATFGSEGSLQLACEQLFDNRSMRIIGVRYDDLHPTDLYSQNVDIGGALAGQHFVNQAAMLDVGTWEILADGVGGSALTLVAADQALRISIDGGENFIDIDAADLRALSDATTNTSVDAGEYIEVDASLLNPEKAGALRFGLTSGNEIAFNATSANIDPAPLTIEKLTLATANQLSTRIVAAINRAERAEQDVGIKADYLVDTGLSHDTAAGVPTGDANDYATRFRVMASLLDGIYVADTGTDELAVVQTWMTNNGDERTVPVMGSVLRTGSTEHPAAAAMTGAFINSIFERGIQRNPSLVPVQGVTDFTAKFAFNFRDRASAAYTVRDAGASAFVRRRGGIVTIGARLVTAVATSPLRYLSNRQVIDMAVDGLAEIAEPHEEENLSQELINALTQDFNKYLRSYNNRFLRTISASPATAQNTRAALDAGELYYDIASDFFRPTGDITANIQVI